MERLPWIQTGIDSDGEDWACFRCTACHEEEPQPPVATRALENLLSFIERHRGCKKEKPDA